MHKCTLLLARTLESVSTKSSPAVAAGGPQSPAGLCPLPSPYISTVSNGQTVSQLSQPPRGLHLLFHPELECSVHGHLVNQFCICI